MFNCVVWWLKKIHSIVQNLHCHSSLELDSSSQDELTVRDRREACLLAFSYFLMALWYFPFSQQGVWLSLAPFITFPRGTYPLELVENYKMFSLRIAVTNVCSWRQISSVLRQDQALLGPLMFPADEAHKRAVLRIDHSLDFSCVVPRNSV